MLAGFYAMMHFSLGFLGSFAKRVMSWLGTLNLYQIGCIVLALLALIEHFELVSGRHHIAKVELQAKEQAKADGATITRLTNEINEAAARSSAKQSATRIIVQKGKDHIILVGQKAKQIETAPLPGNCKTPPIILGADL